MNNVDMLDLEQKIHQWCNLISHASIKQGWQFSVGFENTAPAQWRGLALHSVLANKMIQILLDESSPTPIRTRIEIMEESSKYIANVVCDCNFPEHIMEKKSGSSALSLEKLEDYLAEVYSVELFNRSEIQNVLSVHLSGEMKSVVKQKI